MYKNYDQQYCEILYNIMNFGSLELNKRTGVATRRIPHAVFTMDLQRELPILHSKKVRWETALKEILWIMQSQSNNVNDLNAHIWDSWADESGSIGKAYGYQVAKPVTINNKTYRSQVDYVLDTLQEDPSSRRAVINLWDVDDLGEMNLTPCCYTSCWTIVDNKLNCLLTMRSADFLVGVPFNTTQYAILTYLFAIHLGVGVGKLTQVMADAHVYMYDSHVQAAKTIIKYIDSDEIKNWHSQITVSHPKKFFDVKPEDVLIIGYDYKHDFKLDVAV